MKCVKWHWLCSDHCLLFSQKNSSFRMNVKSRSFFHITAKHILHTHINNFPFPVDSITTTTIRFFLLICLFFSFVLYIENWQPIHFSENDAKFNWIANKLLADMNDCIQQCQKRHTQIRDGKKEYFAVYKFNATNMEFTLMAAARKKISVD